jgi:RNA polymerase sigma-70 factor (ECF subfamily)
MTSPSNSTEANLIFQAQQGQQEAVSSLVEIYLPIVYQRIRFKIPEEDVEDVTQDVLIAMMKSLSQFRGAAKFSTWLYTLVNRKVADYYRRRHPPDVQPLDLNEDIYEHRNIHYNSPVRDEHFAIRLAFKKLPNHYQEVLLQRFVDEIPFNEIAQQNGQSLEAIKSLFRRAVIALRNEMGETHV